MAIDAHAAHVLTDVAKFSLRIGSHAARSGIAAGERIGADSIRTGLHLSERVLAKCVAVGEEIERPAMAAMRAAGIEVESLYTDDDRKLHYDFFAGVTPEILNPGGTLPGANQWHRPISKAHPNPVILMHGTSGGAQSSWGLYVPLLVQQGFSPFTLTYGAVKTAPWPLSALGGMAPMEDSAAEFGEFVDKVLDATGADKVDVVGHSQGTRFPAITRSCWAAPTRSASTSRWRHCGKEPRCSPTSSQDPSSSASPSNFVHHVHFACRGADDAWIGVPRGAQFRWRTICAGHPVCEHIDPL